MLFLLKVDQKNKENQNNFSKFEKLIGFLNKIRLLAKKVVTSEVEISRY